MKVGKYTHSRHIELCEEAIPDISDDEALIKVSYTGICGTDMMIYSGKHPRVNKPTILGHEISGIIQNIGGNNKLKKGDKVVIQPTLSCKHCNSCKRGLHHICENLNLIGIDIDGGFAEYVKSPIDCLHKIPNNLSSSIASLAEPTAVALHSVNKANLNERNSITIIGAGPIGLLIGLIAKQKGVKNIFIVDISSFRLEISKKLGFRPIHSSDYTVKKIIELNENLKMDIVFEVAGIETTLNQSIDLVKSGGKILLVSVFKTMPKINLQEMHYRELSLEATRCYTTKEFIEGIDFLYHNQNTVCKLISQTICLNEINRGFELMEDTNQSLKILIQR